MLLRLTEERQENTAVYDLLSSSLQLLDDGIDPFAVTRHFELVLLTLLGYKPELYRCLNCDTELTAERNALSNRMGGMLCPRCVTADAGAFPLTINSQKYLRTLDRSGLAAAVRLPLDQSLKNELEGALAGYIRFHAERDLQSLKVWHAMDEASSSQTR
jgi:DNA repair protein RecO (recombination protein O)